MFPDPRILFKGTSKKEDDVDRPLFQVEACFATILFLIGVGVLACPCMGHGYIVR